MTTTDKTAQVLSLIHTAAAAALVQAGLDAETLDRLLGNSAEFAAKVQEDLSFALNQFGLPNQYADEEVESTHVYLSGYTAPAPIPEQHAALRKVFDELYGYDERAVSMPVPAICEGLFLLPRWVRVAPTYGEAVEKALEALSRSLSGRFYNYRQGELAAEFLRRHVRTTDKLRELATQQRESDFLIVPAQFGMRHRGRSVRRVREVFQANEFGLGAFEIACMLIAHPTRLAHYDDLWLDAPGDEYAPDAGGEFSSAPRFRFDDGQVEFGTSWFGDAGDGYGSVSGCLPE